MQSVQMGCRHAATRVSRATAKLVEATPSGRGEASGRVRDKSSPVALIGGRGARRHVGGTAPDVARKSPAVMLSLARPP